MIITNSQMLFLRFSLRNSSCNVIGNEGIYNVGEVKEEPQQYKLSECSATHWQVGLPTSQLPNTWHNRISNPHVLLTCLMAA